MEEKYKIMIIAKDLNNSIIKEFFLINNKNKKTAIELGKFFFELKYPNIKEIIDSKVV